jgi:ubiquinone/menaquinone biosynthesis C-methylase UbiE
LAEFTGERVIPGLVDTDLFNEHVSRYKFAARLISGDATVLDLGCGTGYGTVELAAAGSITGADIAAEAVAHAREHYGRDGVRFIEASCTAVPLEDEQFDVITAFEVIEHLEDWRGLLREARRLLKPDGVFVVSTPNKSYYAETRGPSGPNPFHCHEFELGEFGEALGEFFPQVRIWTQNHADAIVFAPPEPDAGALEAVGSVRAEEAHFYLGLCGLGRELPNEVFAWVPESGNVLRERERHVAKLEDELAEKDKWLSRCLSEHAELQRAHEKANQELEQQNRWAQQLNLRIAEQEDRISELQNEAIERLDWLRSVETNATAMELGLREWAGRLETELAEKVTHVKILMSDNADLTNTIEGLLAAIQDMKAERTQVAQSRWMRLGRAIHLGPVLPDAE